MKRNPKEMTNSATPLNYQKESFLALLTPRQSDLEEYNGKTTPGTRLRSAVGRDRKPIISIRFDRMNTDNPKPISKTISTTSLNQRAMTETNSGYETLMTPRKQVILVKEKLLNSKDSLAREDAEERLRQKILENERMRVELYRMENEVRICQNNLKTAFNNKDDTTFTTSQLSDKELKEILYTLNLYLKRSEETFEDLKKKCSKLDELINYMDSGHLAIFKGLEVKDISDYLKHLLQEFKTTSQLELELGIRSRELVKKKLDYAHLNSKHNKLSIRCEALQKDLDALKESLKAEHVEKNIFVKSLTKEKTLNRENQKKLGNLQQTLELLIEAPHPKSEEEFALEAHLKDSFQMHVENPTHFKPNSPPVPQPQKPEDNITKLRDALSKLVKDNEALRRIIHVKGKEFKKLSDNLAKTTWKLDKANIRIEKLRNLKGGHKMNDGTQDEDDLLVAYSKQKSQTTKSSNDSYIDNTNGLPKNLDFRFGFFEERYVDLVNDVLEGGSQAFAEHIRMLTSDEEVKQEITLISNQFISFRNFAEKMNRMMSECVHLLSLKSINQVMVYISNSMKQIFGAQTIRMWAHEHSTGIFRTMETQEKELKCLANRGLISEVIRTSNPILRRNREDKVVVVEYLHPDGTASEEKVHTCLLVPLRVSNGHIAGVLEISKFNYEAFLLDMEYFAQIIVEISRILFDKLNYEKIITNDLKHKDMFFDVFAELANSISEREFAEKIEEWVPQVFQTSRAQYFQANASDLIRFPKGENPIYASGNLGIIGKVSMNKKPFILLENAGNALYSENIDIKTTFPLYTTPVILKKRYVKADEDETALVGVLQIVMNQKYVGKGIETEDSLANYVKTLDPSFENLISKFTKLVAIAFDVMNQRKEPKK